MKIRSSLKSLKKRALKEGGQVIKRGGKTLIICKKGRFKAKQG